LIQTRVTLTTRAGLRDVIEGNDQTSRAAVERLRPYRWVADFDLLRRAYDREKDQGCRKRIEQDYSTLTGRRSTKGPID
jgi:hypothetical protein